MRECPECGAPFRPAEPACPECGAELYDEDAKAEDKLDAVISAVSAALRSRFDLNTDAGMPDGFLFADRASGATYVLTIREFDPAAWGSAGSDVAAGRGDELRSDIAAAGWQVIESAGSPPAPQSHLSFWERKARAEGITP